MFLHFDSRRNLTLLRTDHIILIHVLVLFFKVFFYLKYIKIIFFLLLKFYF
jgi:hypothetical protein